MRMAILALSAVIASQVSAVLACDLSPVKFEGTEWSAVVESVLPRGLRDSGGEFPILSMELGFSDPRYEEWADGEVVDVLVSATLDASQMIETWKDEAKERAEKRGCGTRTQWAKDFTWKIVDGGDVEGKFRVQHEDWSCGSIPFTGRRWKNRNSRVDATIWQTFKPRLRNDRNDLNIEFSGRYKDNVPSALVDLVKVFANVASVEPVLSEVAKVDEGIFVRLKEYRDAISEIERFRVLGNGAAGLVPVGTESASVLLDLVFSEAKFEEEGRALRLALALGSRRGKSILPSQACVLKEGLEKARLQGQVIGPDGRPHLVARGENAWTIARNSYGDGRYFQLLAAANNMDDPDMLREGDEIRLEPLSSFLDRDDVMVLHSGDSLWALSNEAGGDSGGFVELLRANGSVVDPDRVYPVQVLRSARGPAVEGGP